ncbi:hypothetical protein FRC12_001057 [Ceratobasidium sp. 428]|nr:hypothetical protein FRC12_001057 [Ceratobasidium sp. 428]
MPASVFTAEERQFIASYLPGWQQLAGSGKQRNAQGELHSPKDDFIDEVVGQFFDQFPERDLEHNPDDIRAFTAAQRGTLHSRVRRIFYDEAAKAPATTDSIRLTRVNKRTDCVMLFKQRYRDDILLRRNAISQSTEPSEQLRAYNQAVQEELAAKQKDFPDLLTELAAEAELARAAAKKPFAQQTSAMQDIILEGLPREISSAMRDWEYRTGAHLFIMGCWGGSDGSTSTFDYATKGCQEFLKSQECEDAQVGWQQWMQKHFGPVLRRTVSEIEAEVYVNEAGLPMLPPIAHLGLPIVRQKQIF